MQSLRAPPITATRPVRRSGPAILEHGLRFLGVAVKRPENGPNRWRAKAGPGVAQVCLRRRKQRRQQQRHAYRTHIVRCCDALRPLAGVDRGDGTAPCWRHLAWRFNRGLPICAMPCRGFKTVASSPSAIRCRPGSLAHTCQCSAVTTPFTSACSPTCAAVTSWRACARQPKR